MKLSELINETREKWAEELKECREAILLPPRTPQNPLDRMVVELDYLLVEAKIALEAKDKQFRELALLLATTKDNVDKLKTQIEAKTRERISHE